MLFFALSRPSRLFLIAACHVLWYFLRLDVVYCGLNKQKGHWSPYLFPIKYTIQSVPCWETPLAANNNATTTETNLPTALLKRDMGKKRQLALLSASIMNRPSTSCKHAFEHKNTNLVTLFVAKEKVTKYSTNPDAF